MRHRSGLGIALITVAATMIGGTTSASAQATPADALVGQRVVACTYGANLAVTVTNALWTGAVAGELAPEGGVWVVALIDVTNIADKTEALTSRPLQLRDGDGRVYLVQEDPPDVTNVADAFGVAPPWQEFVPGVTTASVVTFLVPTEVGPLTFEGRNDC